MIKKGGRRKARCGLVASDRVGGGSNGKGVSFAKRYIYIYTHVPSKQRARVGLTVSGSRIIIRKAVHGDGEQGPADEDIVCECAERAEPEGPVTDVAAAANEKSDDRDGVGDVEEDDAGRDHTMT